MPPALSARQVVLRDVERPLKVSAPERKLISMPTSCLSLQLQVARCFDLNHTVSRYDPLVTYMPGIYVLFSSSLP